MVACLENTSCQAQSQIDSKGKFYLDYIANVTHLGHSHPDGVVERMKSRKILLSFEGLGHNVLKFKPPIVFNLRDAQHMLSELEMVLGESPRL